MTHTVALFLTHPVDWLLNNGVGQNITAGVMVGVVGFAWSRTKFWPLHAIHAKLDSLHAKHDALATRVEDLHRKR